MGEGQVEMKVEIDWGDASTSRRTPKVVGSPLKGGSRHGTDSSLQPSERTILPALISDFSLQNSQTMHFYWVSPSVSDTLLQWS